MTTETQTETTVPTDAPAQKQKRHIPFTRKNVSVETDATENTPATRKGPHGIYLAGALLVGAGIVAAAASKLGKKTEDSETETTHVITDVA